jgi:hypothetical protein
MGRSSWVCASGSERELPEKPRSAWKSFLARAYRAVCTLDFFGYNADRKLKYRGRVDEGRTTPPRAGAPRELVEAMRAIANTGVAPAHQKASIGCSIKWKDA